MNRFAAICAVPAIFSGAELADGDINHVKHIVIVMQENRSFDNYFGALAYAPESPYHNGNGVCATGDHQCVDGLSCTHNDDRTLSCSNSIVDGNGNLIYSYHTPSRCLPGINHGWTWTHQSINWNDPGDTLAHPQNDGFVRADGTAAMSFYDQTDLPFYYDLAQKFALDDRYFASVPGPTMPNRSYLMAATSFGHTTSNDSVPPLSPLGYRP